MTATRQRRTPSLLDRRAQEVVRRIGAALGDRRARPDPRWLAALTGASGRQISETLCELDEHVELLTDVRRRLREAGRPFYAQIRAPFELYALTRIRRPAHVVETGVSSGISSLHFLLALRRNRYGTLHSIDRPTPQRASRFGPRDSPVALPPGRSSGWAVPPELTGGWDLRIGPSEVLLPALVEQIDSVGLFLHDSRHTPAHLAFELAAVEPKLVPGAIVLADNTIWTGAAFPQFARRIGARVRRRGRTDLVGATRPPCATARGAAAPGPARPPAL